MLKASCGSSRSTVVMSDPTYGVVEATVWFGRQGSDSAPPPVAIYLFSHRGYLLSKPRRLASGSVSGESPTRPPDRKNFSARNVGLCKSLYTPTIRKMPLGREHNSTRPIRTPKTSKAQAVRQAEAISHVF